MSTPSVVKLPSRRIVFVVTCDLFGGSTDKNWQMEGHAFNLLAADGFPLRQPFEIPLPPPPIMAALLAEYSTALVQKIMPPPPEGIEGVPMAAEVAA